MTEATLSYLILSFFLSYHHFNPSVYLWHIITLLTSSYDIYLIQRLARIRGCNQHSIPSRRQLPTVRSYTVNSLPTIFIPGFLYITLWIDEDVFLYFYFYFYYDFFFLLFSSCSSSPSSPTSSFVSFSIAFFY